MAEVVLPCTGGRAVSDAFVQLGVALALGLLVGLQREWVGQPEAGIRTFAFITMLGALCGQLADRAGGWVVAAGLLSTAVLLVSAQRREEAGKGLTTEFAAVAMFAVGASVVLFDMVLSVVVAGIVAVLLQWKKPLHQLVRRVDSGEMRMVMQLVLIALVVLPVLPDRAFGPYDVLNPFQIWLMVVLICGISVAGYTAYRLLGSRTGTLLTGFLGGLISSTATTVSFAQRARQRPETSSRAAVVIVIASAVVFFRVLLEIVVVAPAILGDVLPPLLIMTAVMVLASGVVLLAARTGEAAGLPIEEDPLDLRSAIAFGLLYGAVLLAVAVAREHLGNSGLFVVAALSGLTDMDAITLSTARLIDSGRLDAGMGWRMIIVGAMSNLAFKAGLVALARDRGLFRPVALAFLTAIAVGAGLVFLWPSG